MPPFKLCIEGEYEGMSEVTANFSFTVSPASTPLQVTVSTPPQLQVGVAVSPTVVAVVSGGTPPYTYAADPNSAPLPAGLSFGEDNSGNISISGTPTQAGTFSGILLDVTDSAANTKKISFR